MLLQARSPRGLEASATDAALYLIVGGLLMLVLVMTLLILRSFFPGGIPPKMRARERAPNRLKETTSHPLEPRRRDLRPIRLDAEEMALGNQVGVEVKAKSVDDVLDWIVDQQAGEPRILNLGSRRMRMRLDDCKECKGRSEERAAQDVHVQGCSYAAGLLQGAFQNLHRANLAHFWTREGKVRVTETRCRLQGLRSCEYEVHW